MAPKCQRYIAELQGLLRQVDCMSACEGPWKHNDPQKTLLQYLPAGGAGAASDAPAPAVSGAHAALPAAATVLAAPAAGCAPAAASAPCAPRAAGLAGPCSLTRCRQQPVSVMKAGWESASRTGERAASRCALQCHLYRCSYMRPDHSC